MTVRPILFSEPMARALLAGTKTQTRRIIKPQPSPEVTSAGVVSRSGIGQTDEWSWLSGDPKDCDTWGGEGEFKTGYRPGDLLWVREAWKAHSAFEGIAPHNIPPSRIFYLADDRYAPSGSRSRASIHMPRWASRLTLEVTGVKVERLQEISKEDAAAEGIERRRDMDDPSKMSVPEFGISGICAGTSARDAYASLWKSINGPGAWDANPWVVAVSFRVYPANIDQIIATRKHIENIEA